MKSYFIKGKILLTLILLLSINNLFAQSFDWTKKTIGESKSMKVDLQGNIYVTGSFTGGINIGGISLSVLGGKDCYIAKYSPIGDLIWVKKAGGLLDDEALDLCLDALGNVYITGVFRGAAKFGTLSLISKGAGDIFILKCKPNGDFEWVKQCGGLLDDIGRGLVIDAAGNLCVTGIFGGTSTFASITLNASAGKAFLCKYNTAGILQLVKQFDCDAKSITADIAGNLFICGAIDLNNKQHACVLKLDNLCNLIWAFKPSVNDPSHIYSYCKDIHVDFNGDVYVTGDFNSKINLGNLTLVGLNLSATDAFYAKIDANGKLVFANKICGSAGGNSGESIITDVHGDIYICGKFNGNIVALNGLVSLKGAGKLDILLTKIDANLGEVVWTRNGGGAGNDQATCIDIDVNGNVFMCGSFSGNAYFGAQILTVSLSLGTESCIGKISQPQYPQAVKSFTLINADTDKEIRVLHDKDTIIVASLATENFNFRANTFPAIVGSVFMKYDGLSRTDAEAPYAVFGDDKGNYNGLKLTVGNHTLSAFPYSKAGSQGEKGQELTIRFYIKDGSVDYKLPTVNAGADKLLNLPTNSIKLYGSANDPSKCITKILWTKTSGPSATMQDIDTYTLSLTDLIEGTYIFRLTVYDNKNNSVYDEATVKVVKPIQSLTSFILINTDNDQIIRELKNNDTIDFTKLTTKNLNIRATTNPTTVGSVIFDYDATKKTDITAPYALFDENNGDYLPGTFTAGSHTLTAAPYTGSNGTGAKGTPKTITFFVIQAPTPPCGCHRLGEEELAETNLNSLNAYPNPFTEYASVEFTATENGNIKLEILNMNGEVVDRIFEGYANSGESMRFELNGTRLTEGYYLVRLSGDKKVYQQQKLSLIK